jgi:hypothetical protein
MRQQKSPSMDFFAPYIKRPIFIFHNKKFIRIMASTSETGHAKNVANFEDLISFVTGYGATYNPTKVPIKLASLTTLLQQQKPTSYS